MRVQHAADHIGVSGNMQGMFHNVTLKAVTEQAGQMRFFSFHSNLTVIAPKSPQCF